MKGIFGVRAMARVAISMMLHGRLKSLGTLLGVVFAVVLSNQQIGTFLGLLDKNVMFVENTRADLWIVPPSTTTLQAGKPLATAVLFRARTTLGVQWAEPLLYGSATVTRPGGGSEQVTLVGTRAPRMAGGPWNVVAGEPAALLRPDTMFFEDSQREKLGGLNLGSAREVNGRRVVVGGFTWGLLPFGPSYAFAGFDTARLLLKRPSDQVDFVLIGVAPGEQPEAVRDRLQREIPGAMVLTRPQFSSLIVRTLLTGSAIGISFGTSTFFGLLVGFVVVSLSMFSAVIDNIREFGTMKAVGATNGDLTVLLLVQSLLYALSGSLIGLALVCQLAVAARSPNLALILPPQLLAGTVVVMILLCITASSLALLRLRSLEPAMVFR
jgi:putative ABC transport system permease protein